MRFNSPLALAVLAGTLSNALPAPQNAPVDPSSLPTSASSDPAIASEQLDQLFAFAQQQANDDLAASSSKRAT